MILALFVVAVDFLLPFALIWSGVWLFRREPIFVKGTRQNLTLWGAAVVVICFVGLMFMGGFLFDPEVNHVAVWLGVRVPESLVTIPNIIKILVTVAMWFGFIYYNASRSLMKRPFRFANLILPGYALYITVQLVIRIIEVARKTGKN